MTMSKGESTRRTDVLGLGAVAVDDILYVESYPPPDAKVPVLRSQRHCGGLTGTALVAASRLGASCAYAGVLGTDELSAFAGAAMERAGVDMSLVRRRPGVSPIHSFIVVAEKSHTRNVFVALHRNNGADPAWPPKEVLLSIKVLIVDHIGLPGMLRAARICRANSIPIVADFERASGPKFEQLLEVVDHLIISQDFAEKLTGSKIPSRAVSALWGKNRETVVVTAGAKGCWYAGRGAPTDVRHHPAFRVNAIDTTGCGDVFHGAYAAALTEQRPLDDRIAFASAAAALKATRHGGQSGIPTRVRVKSFLRQHRSGVTAELPS